MTEIIVRGRQGGKTTELIRRAAETSGYIVCTDQKRARQIAEHAREMGLNIPFPLTASEWQRHGYHPPGAHGLLFDDLDRIIQGMSSAPVLAASWTADEPDFMTRTRTEHLDSSTLTVRLVHEPTGITVAASDRPEGIIKLRKALAARARRDYDLQETQRRKQREAERKTTQA